MASVAPLAPRAVSLRLYTSSPGQRLKGEIRAKVIQRKLLQVVISGAYSLEVGKKNQKLKISSPDALSLVHAEELDIMFLDSEFTMESLR
jgi:hypothetical protein